ncbi:hypothetical protein AB834_04440 [PVC group bacterium (ex Bugula neritina AB1)]|nr:hypothetical protein AB834_04440 [PVC group bacterium (ex Bugula neritina AB1)]
MASYLGVDIGANSIKVAELKKTRRGVVLKKAGYFPYNEIPSFDELALGSKEAEVLRWILSQNQIKKAEAIVAVPSQEIFTKYIALPPVKYEQVDQIVHFEARQQIPFHEEDISWAYHLLSSDVNKDNMNVVLHAIKNDFLNSFIENITDTKLSIKALDVPGMALYNLASYNNVSTGSMLLDIGQDQTEVLIVSDRGFWSRNLSLSGKHFTDFLSEKMKINRTLAEEFKQNVGFKGEGLDSYRSEVLEEIVGKLLDEVKKTEEDYLSQDPKFSLKKIYITGGSSRMLGMIDFMVEKFDAEVELLDPFESMEISSAVGSTPSEEMRHFFGVAAGLALRQILPCPVQINLLPKEVKKARYVQKIFFILWAITGLLVMFFAFCVYDTKFEINRVSEGSKRLKKESEKFLKLESSIGEKVKRINSLEAKLIELKKVSLKKLFLIDTLLDLQKVTEDDMHYTLLQWGLSRKELMEWQNHLKKDPQRKALLKSQKIDFSLLDKGIASLNDFLIQGVTNDSYLKIDNLKIALESYDYIKKVDVQLAEEKIVEDRMQINYHMIINVENRES